jgi:diguanylate cyclase (GGDEF)-like protein/PAS domain S-box-containing protein
MSLPLMARLRRLFGSRPGSGADVSNDILAAKTIVEASADVIMRIGMDMHANYVSPSSLQVLGYRPDEIVGRGPGEFVHPDDLAAVVHDSRLHLAGNNPSEAITHRMVRKDGGVIWVECRNRAVFDPKTKQRTDFVLIMRDITVQKTLEDELKRLALTDGLTGLANRRAFDQALEAEWLRTMRLSTHMSLLLLDLDHFKRFNDHYGHQVGDDCLRAVAAAITRATRQPSDLAARYGGEEFAVILPGTNSASAVDVAERIRSDIHRLMVPHENNPPGNGFVTTSIGLATALCRPGGTMDMRQSLLAAADTALYKAKQNGRNQVATALVLAPADTEGTGSIDGERPSSAAAPS